MPSLPPRLPRTISRLIVWFRYDKVTTFSNICPLVELHSLCSCKSLSVPTAQQELTLSIRAWTATPSCVSLLVHSVPCEVIGFTYCLLFFFLFLHTDIFTDGLMLLARSINPSAPSFFRAKLSPYSKSYKPQNKTNDSETCLFSPLGSRLMASYSRCNPPTISSDRYATEET